MAGLLDVVPPLALGGALLAGISHTGGAADGATQEPNPAGSPLGPAT